MSNIAFSSLRLTRLNNESPPNVEIEIDPSGKNLRNVYLEDYTGDKFQKKLVGTSEAVRELTLAEREFNKNNQSLDELTLIRNAVKLFGKESDIKKVSKPENDEKSIKDGNEYLSAWEFFNKHKTSFCKQWSGEYIAMVGGEIEEALPYGEKFYNDSDNQDDSDEEQDIYSSATKSPLNEREGTIDPADIFGQSPNMSVNNSKFDVMAKNYYEETPLFQAVDKNNPERTQAILEKVKEKGLCLNEYVNMQNARGDTAISYIKFPKDANKESVAKTEELINILLDAGANLKIPNNQGIYSGENRQKVKEQIAQYKQDQQN